MAKRHDNTEQYDTPEQIIETCRKAGEYLGLALGRYLAALEGASEQGAASNLHAPPLLKVREAAAYLAISRSRLYELVKEGKIRPIRVGRSPRYRRVDLDAFAAQGSH